jgi:hypothetical protein
MVMENELNFANDFSAVTAAKASTEQREACNSSNRARSEEKDQLSFVELIVSAHAPCK